MLQGNKWTGLFCGHFGHPPSWSADALFLGVVSFANILHGYSDFTEHHSYLVSLSSSSTSREPRHPYLR